MSDPKAISVTRLVRRMRNLLEIELGEVWVEGEISNFKRQASGHCYFTLKDEGGQIPAVLFRGNAKNVKCELEDGMQVLVFGEASLYEARGQVQLIVRKVEQQGEGDLQKRFEALKQKLRLEGLFDEQRKKKLPPYPASVGLITSGTGAALQDMLNVMQRRAPWVQPVLYPVQVQGAGAEHGIAAAIQDWGQNPDLPEVDVIIVGRGGGSMEDLWNFNEEVVARAIAACPIPIVSAVGHEVDFTIADFVADHRAPTPSAAAELVVPDGEEIAHRVNTYKNLFDRVVERKLEHTTLKLENLKQIVLARSPENYLRESALRVDQLAIELEHRLESAFAESSHRLDQLRQRYNSLNPIDLLEKNADRLQRNKEDLEVIVERRMEKCEVKLNSLQQMHRALGPQTAFARGFSVTTDSTGKVMKSTAEVESGMELVTEFADGKVKSVATK